MGLFGLKLLTGVFVAHLYVWWRCVYCAAWPRVGQWLLSLLLAAGAACFVTGFYTNRFASFHNGHTLQIIAWVWTGALLFAFGIRLTWDVVEIAVRAALLVARRRPGRGAAAAGPSDRSADATETPRAERLSRRVLLARSAAVSAGAGAGVLSLGAYRDAVYDITTPTVAVRLPRLPRALDGFRIALLADLHIGPYLDDRFTARAVEIANGLKPDAVAICGDLIDRPPARILRDLAPLTGLRSRCGAFFVTGNHEYYWEVRDCMAAVRTLGIRVLANERVPLGDRAGGASFDLAGIHDETGRRWDDVDQPRTEPIAAGRDPDHELILLAHQPLQLPDALKLGAGLQLSGHTHGGQIWPFGAMIQVSQPYIAGLHQHTPKTQIYVSRGTGFWGPPMRVLAPAEVTTIVLTSA